MSKVAAFDLGTNSFICLIASKNSLGEIVVEEEMIEQVRLGQGLGVSGKISDEAFERAEVCIKKFIQRCKLLGVQEIRALGTSAARDAKNGHLLFELADKYGFKLEIITGEKEAEFSFQGALVGLKTPLSSFVILDIGGGSTELIFVRNNKVDNLVSINCGAVRLTERFFSAQPPRASEILMAKNFLDDLIELSLKNLDYSDIKHVVGVAGTPTSLAAIKNGQFSEEIIHGSSISNQDLSKFYQEFSLLSSKEIDAKYSLGPRSDIILAGSLILTMILNRFQINELIISTKGVRYGLALQMLEEK